MGDDVGKVGRTVRLTPEINQRLLDLCAHLGTNPNAYLVTEIGKAVARDEVSFRAVAQNKAMYDVLEGFLTGAQNES